MRGFVNGLLGRADSKPLKEGDQNGFDSPLGSFRFCFVPGREVNIGLF